MKGVIFLFEERSYVPPFVCEWPDRGSPTLCLGNGHQSGEDLGGGLDVYCVGDIAMLLPWFSLKVYTLKCDYKAGVSSCMFSL